MVDLRAGAEQLREGLREAAHEVGFFYLTGHGVPETLIARLLGAARRLFALPDADKDAVAMVRSPHFRGYTRMGGERTLGEVDWREQIDIGPERPAIGGPGKPGLPLAALAAGPQPMAGRAARVPGSHRGVGCRPRVARTLFRHWAASLGSLPEVFDDAFAETPATLIKVIRLSRPCGCSPRRAAGSCRCGGVRHPMIGPANGSTWRHWTVRLS